MKIIKCPLNLITIESKENFDERYVFEHLKYILSESDTFPAINVDMEKDELLLVDGQIYWKIAKELGLKEITAIVKYSNVKVWEKFLSENNIEVLSSEELFEKDALVKTITHTIFFSKNIDAKQSDILKQQIKETIDNVSVSNWLLSEHTKMIEFETSLVQETSATELLNVFDQFSLNICEIHSYQGVKYQANH